LQSGRIQVGVSRYLGPVEPIEGLEFTHLLDDPFVVALAATHPLAKRKSLRTADLHATGSTTYPKDPQSRFAEHTVALLRSSGGQSPVAYEAADIHTALGMVASHLGFCLVGRSVSRGSRSDLAFLPLLDLRDQAAVFAVTKAGENSKVVTAFVAALLRTSRLVTATRILRRRNSKSHVRPPPRGGSSQLRAMALPGRRLIWMTSAPSRSLSR
jgi:LysR family transcriptional regulator, benzoate and cis,cis-muconate-responsive activator of ben and cat genes